MNEGGPVWKLKQEIVPSIPVLWVTDAEGTAGEGGEGRSEWHHLTLHGMDKRKNVCTCHCALGFLYTEM